MQPNHGLAEYCLAEISLARKAPVNRSSSTSRTPPRATVSASTPGRHWPCSTANDSTNTVKTSTGDATGRHPPTSRCGEQVFRYFLNHDQPLDAANGCRTRARHRLPAMPSSGPHEQRLSLPGRQRRRFTVRSKRWIRSSRSTRPGPTALFITKAIYAAAATQPRHGPVRSVGQLSASRSIPTNGAMLAHRVTAYASRVRTDSRRGGHAEADAVDSTDLTPVVRALKAIPKRNAGKRRGVRSGYVDRLGGPRGQTELRPVILAHGALPLLQQTTQNLRLAAEMARKAVHVVPAGCAHATQPGEATVLRASTSPGSEQKCDRRRKSSRRRKLETRSSTAGARSTLLRRPRCNWHGTTTVIKGLDVRRA